MILISESSSGGQRVSLKLELWSTGELALSPPTYRCKQNRNISLLFYMCFPNATFHSRWITSSSLMYTMSKILIY